MSHDRFSRRHFFYGSLLAGAVPAGGFGTTPALKFMGYKSPNEKLNIAAIGAGGKGASDIAGCVTENIVALADPDSKRAAQTFQKYEKAAKYADFRKMFDKESKNIDAVIVSTPDHMHATASLWAMERGKHLYCQKPLTRTIWEARTVTAAAAKYKVATQMGNQGYSNEGTRQCAEMIWAGEIGNVTEVHAWTNRPIWPQGLETLPQEAAVPETLDWDTWLGISSMRPYSPAYLPFNWRGWFDFGCGALGDMACHILGAPNVALLLGAPTSVECIMQEGKSPYTYPKKSIIRFDFPARGSMPPVKIFWYDGMSGPPKRPEGLAESELLGDLPRSLRGQGGPGQRGVVGETVQADRPVGPPPEAPSGPPPGAPGGNPAFRIPPSSNGSLFVGEKGFITTGTYGENTRLVPAEKMQDYKFPPPLLTRSPGHYRDWIRAAKGGERSCSDFSVAGPFTEWILLGVIALRFEGKLEWDSAKMKITNVPEANQLIKPKIRKGWQIG
ncbi:MAG: Gfo/Idh/MocA family oxidoreductase [Candidatus Solibacter usitatus]|nr:Gfo/Idh/MocA family oxidoreductase [Candidatus Solibacter usitatus]